jgi:hypothetical protein
MARGQHKVQQVRDRRRFLMGRQLARQAREIFDAETVDRFLRKVCDLADCCYRQSKKPVLSRSSGRFAGPEHDDFRADRRAVVEIDDVLIRQADAARRDVGANGPGFIGAVDAVERVLVAAPEVHGPCAKRIIGTALHADAALQLHHVLAQLGLARQHFRGRIPIGPFLLAMHCRTPGPNKALRADAHAIANGLSGVVDEVKKMTTWIDDDCSRPLVCRVGDDLAGEGGIKPSRLFPRHRKDARIGRPAYAGGKNQQHSARYTPHDLHLPAWKTPEPDFHNDILNQMGGMNIVRFRRCRHSDKGQGRI